MPDNRKTYRIRTGVGNEAPSSINVSLTQTFDTVDVLSLEINQKNFYRMPSSGYGVIVGRVIANGGFGIPNAKVSVFVPYDKGSLVEDNGTLYHYMSPMSKDSDGIRYNLLPRKTDDVCHQDVGTLWEKEYLLDNRDFIQVFEKYYKYTAVTNNAGDYFIYGVPVGSQTVHVDLDLSDIGVLSQRPRDMMYKGYGADMFESPNKFKKDTNLNSLAQIYSQDKVVTVYPFWGDTSVDPTNGIITRCDIQVDYKFEPTCVFMGSIVSDTGDRAISQRCVPDDEIGKMSELIAGEGKIEMIRKTFDGKVEEFSIKGNNLIDGNGVWCYQIPMNLDYVKTDEFGNMVPTDDPSIGIPTRTRVRFRIGMNETDTDETARKRARFLVPNNPRLNSDYPDFNMHHKADYEFGTFTKDESYRDLFWNKVYTVKSYVPRLQKAKALRRRVHTGIKNVNHAGANNPFPFNNFFARLTFTYRFICTLMTILCVIVYLTNNILGDIGVGLYYIGRFLHQVREAKDSFWVGLFTFGVSWVTDMCFLDSAAYLCFKACENIVIKLENFCDDGNFDTPVYVPIRKKHRWLDIVNGATNVLNDYHIVLDGECLKKYTELNGNDYVFRSGSAKIYDPDLSRLFNCIENQLAQDQECTSFNFSNDWVNGVLYAPLWYRKVKSKRKIFFGLFTTRAKDKWCSGTSSSMSNRLSLCQTCAQKREVEPNNLELKSLKYNEITTSNILTNINEDNCYGYKCHKKTVSFINLNSGLIIQKETMFGENVYYYKSVEYDGINLKSQTEEGKLGDIKLLFATDIVLLGSLNECDAEGIPQFFKRLAGTTYNMPPDLVLMDYSSKEDLLKFEPKAQGDSDTNGAESAMNIGDGGLSKIDDDIDESDAIANKDDIYTDTTGADWGNFGWDQANPSYITNNGYYPNNYLYTTTMEKPDYGGLFYGLTCWSVYTKPKTCVNVSRVCEYGVSLDTMYEIPDYTTFDPNNDEGYIYTQLRPDGFISYDELYDNDGRAMFATMNGNNLRTKINRTNGFPVYDFMYLYPENFDGSMKDIMSGMSTMLDSPMDKNFRLENSSEAYIRFRYGRNRNDSKVIQYYDSTTQISLYNGKFRENSYRFPKYENSFYFYFGLVPGNTAIDKFRTLYYSECQDTDGEHSVASFEYKPSSWCSEVRGEGNDGEVSYGCGDGWVSIDATYVEAPYQLHFENMSGNTAYDVHIEDWIEYPKVFISFTDIEMPEGYVHMMDEDGNPYMLMNDRYRIRIVDANGEELTQYIDFFPPRISATFGGAPFRRKNDELEAYFGNSGDILLKTATLGGIHSNTIYQDMSDRNDVGGFIKVTDISQDGDRLVNFSIEIKPLFDVNHKPSVVSGTQEMMQQYEPQRLAPTSYTGSYVEIHQRSNPDVNIPNVVRFDDTCMWEQFVNLPPYCPYGYDFPQYSPTSTQWNVGVQQTNGGKYDFRFGVPLGDKRYRVTLTMLCEYEGKFYKSRNASSSIVIVPQPIEFKMLLNGTDYKIIKNFETGWAIRNENNELYLSPFVEYGSQTLWYIIDKSHIKGWLDMDNLDGLVELEEVEDEYSSTFTYYNQNAQFSVYMADMILSNNPSFMESNDHTSYYNWTGEYELNLEDVIVGVDIFETVPQHKQSGVGFIKVFNQTYGDYVFYLWDRDTASYLLYRRGTVFPVYEISMEEYYNNCDIPTKNFVINAMNEITRLRKEAVETVKQSFRMGGGEEFDLEVKSITNEKPVHTLIYYAPDLEDGTSIESIDMNPAHEENICYDITVPTITGEVIDGSTGNIMYTSTNQIYETMGVSVFTPIDYTQHKCKNPFLVGVENNILETLPVELEVSHPGITISRLNLPINEIGEQLFGVHVIDKRLRYVCNLWAPMENWVYYYNANLYDDTINNVNPEDYFGNSFTIKGLFAGFVLNGLPESYNYNIYYPETFFYEQNVGGRNFDIITFSSSGYGSPVNENRIPVVRWICSETADDNWYYDYSFGDAIDATQNEGKRHILVDSLNECVKITDKETTAIFSCNFEVKPPQVDVSYDEENDNYYYCSATFENDGYYTFFEDKSNPVYLKYLTLDPDNNNHCLVFPSIGGNTRNMDFWNMNFVHSGSTTTFYTTKPFTTNSMSAVTTLYVVKLSRDLQKRCVSRTYDLTPVEGYYLAIGDPYPIPVCLKINLGKDSSSQPLFYYLKYYNFTIEVVNDEGTTIKTVTVENGYNGRDGVYSENLHLVGGSPVTNEAGVANPTKVINVIIERFANGNDEMSNYVHMLENCDTYITDATGLRRKIIKIDAHDKFSHTFGAQ